MIFTSKQTKRGPRGPFIAALVITTLTFLIVMAMVAAVLGQEIMQIYFEPSYNVMPLK